MNGIRHVFFDLDNTLWDFDRNSDAALRVVFEQFGLQQRGVPNVDAFLGRYLQHNDAYWAMYRDGRIDQERLRWIRYDHTLRDFGIDDRHAAIEMSRVYLEVLAQQHHLMGHTLELLDGLRERYPLHIITNGFEDVQRMKLRGCGLTPYFRTMTTSEQAGAVKPDPRIFHTALESAGAAASESLYVGDAPEVDGSATGVGMAFIWFNPGRVQNRWAHDEVANLRDLAARFAG